MTPCAEKIGYCGIAVIGMQQSGKGSPETLVLLTPGTVGDY